MFTEWMTMLIKTAVYEIMLEKGWRQIIKSPKRYRNDSCVSLMAHKICAIKHEIASNLSGKSIPMYLFILFMFFCFV